MFKYISKYWLCQILGWGTMMAISLFFVYTSGKIDSNYTISLLISCLLGIFITHMMRYFIKKAGKFPALLFYYTYAYIFYIVWRHI